MPAMTGSFSGNIRLQTAISLPDQTNHSLSLAEISGTQKCSDEKWNNATITYWGITDLTEGKGTQHGYFVNAHSESDRDWGTFEAKVTTTDGQTTVEGTWQFTGGSGSFRGLTGDGTFKTRVTSATELEGSWQGAYELAAAKAQAG